MQSGFISQCRKSISIPFRICMPNIDMRSEGHLRRFERVGTQCAVFALLAIARKLS